MYGKFGVTYQPPPNNVILLYHYPFDTVLRETNLQRELVAFISRRQAAFFDRL